MKAALEVLHHVYSTARRLWPACREHEQNVVKVDIGQLKIQSVGQVAAGTLRRIWAMVKLNDSEATVKLMPAAELITLIRDGGVFELIEFETMF